MKPGLGNEMQQWGGENCQNCGHMHRHPKGWCFCGCRRFAAKSSKYRPRQKRKTKKRRP